MDECGRIGYRGGNLATISIRIEEHYCGDLSTHRHKLYFACRLLLMFVV